MTEQTSAERLTISLLAFLRENGLNWLLLFVPASIALKLAHASDTWIFITSALAIIPLAGLIGQATEELSERVGPAWGGFLNATFGNATELIIAIFALAGGLPQVVKASISGSIIGNILLVLGASMFVGGLGREKQHFSRTRAGASSAMLFLAVVALVMPAIFDRVEHPSANLLLREEHLSLLVAIVLIITYAGSLVFTLFTHNETAAGPVGKSHELKLTTANAVILLAAATALTAVESELLVGAIHTATRALHMTEFFIGVIVVAIIGNAAEHFTAVMAARKNQMDLAMNISTGSSIQIALFVAPALVFISYLFGPPLVLVFNPFEVVAIALSVVALAVVTLDGESNWLEGLQLIAVYFVLGIVFYFVQ